MRFTLPKTKHFDASAIEERLRKGGYGSSDELVLIDDLCEQAVRRALENQAEEIWQYLEGNDPEISDTYRTSDTARRRIRKVLEPLRPRCKATSSFDGRTITCTDVTGHGQWSGAMHTFKTANGLSISWATE